MLSVRMNVSKLLSCVAICALFGSVAIVAGNGSTPNGKPFVKINDQLIEVSGAVTSVQTQVDLLVTQVDTIEGRVVALETAVSDIEANNVMLEAMISQNTTDIASINQAVLDLQAENVILQAQVDANSGDIQTDQAQIAANSTQIASLQTAIIALENGSIAADANLQTLINNNLALITAMQGEIDLINSSLALKQNIIEGTCPDGEAVIAIGENSITCGEIDGGSSTISVSRTSTYTGLSPNQSKTLYAYCPWPSRVTGGGFQLNHSGIVITKSYALGQSTWQVEAVNKSGVNNVGFYSLATCLHVN